MANIPVYNTPEARPAPLSGEGFNVNRAGQNDFTQVGAAVNNAVAQGVHLYREEKKRAREEAATNQLTAFKQAGDARMFNSDPNAGPLGLLRQKGVAAMADTAEDHGNAYGAIENARQSFTKGLDDDAKALYLERSAALVSEYKRMGENHVFTQSEAAAAASQQAITASVFKSVSQRPEDDQWAETQLKTLEPSIRAQALSPQDADAKLGAVRAKVTEQRLDALINQEDPVSQQRAKEILEGAKSGAVLDGSTSAHYQFKLDVAASKSEGITWASKAVAEARSTDPEAPFLDVAKLEEKINSWPPGRTRQTAEAEVMRLKAVALQGEQDTKKAYYDSALADYLNGGHSLSSIKATSMQWLRDHAGDMAVKLEEMDAKRMERMRMRTERKSSKDTTDEALALFDGLKELNDNPEWKKRNAHDLEAAFRNDVSESGFNKLGMAFARLKAGKPATTPVIPSREAKVLQTFIESELAFPASHKTWNAEQKETAAHALSYVQDKYADYVQTHSKEPSHEEMTGWAREQTARGVVKDSGFNLPLIGPVGVSKPSRAEFETRAKYKGKTLLNADGVPAAPQTAKPKPSSAAPKTQPPAGMIAVRNTKTGKTVHMPAGNASWLKTHTDWVQTK